MTFLDSCEKMCWPKNGPFRAKKGPKRGQNEVLGYFHVENASVFASVAYYNRESRFLVIGGDQSSEQRFCWH